MACLNIEKNLLNYKELKMLPNYRRIVRILSLLIVPSLGALSVAGANATGTYEFATPIFGLARAPAGGLLVADAGAGIVEQRKGVRSLVAELPGVTDIAPIRDGVMWATRGGGPGLTTGALFRVNVPVGRTRLVADLFAFEELFNPHPEAVDSNPFDVEALSGGMAVVADAGGNDLLKVDSAGNVDWIAALPDQIVSSGDLKKLAGCPATIPGFEFICGLPELMPAQPVATSVAIGPDGAYYVGELKGFPAPRGRSRIWRIEPWAFHAQCGKSPDCKVVARGFTSIVDLSFGPDGTLYVVELDEASWAAVEFPFPGLGGTVNACDISTWTCSQIAKGLAMPIAATVDRQGKVRVAINALIPGKARVITLP